MDMKYKNGVTLPVSGKSVGNKNVTHDCSGTMVIQPIGWSIEMTRGKPLVFWKTKNDYKMICQHLKPSNLSKKVYARSGDGI